jgi:hypothetical protein
MGTVLISNLAPIDDAACRMFNELFSACESMGHTAVFWSCIHLPVHSSHYLPMRWDIARWAGLYEKGVLDAYRHRCDGVDRVVWLSRINRLCKQSAPKNDREALLDTVCAVSLAIIENVRPDLFLCWNTLCPHTGILAGLCRNRGIPVHLLERGPLPETWYFETGGLVGHSVLADVPLESLLAPDTLSAYALFGQQMLQEMKFGSFNSYPQQGGTEVFERVSRMEQAGPKVVFFPPDDTSLGFTPEDHEDRRKHLPGYVSSYEAALCIARENTGGITLFKPHPSFIDEMIPETGEYGLLAVQEDFRRLIEWADVVATTGSGLQLVALAAGKPVISMGRDLLTGKGIAYEAQFFEHVAAALSQAASGADLQERLLLFQAFSGYLLRHYLLSLDIPDGRRPGFALERLLGQFTFPSGRIDIAETRKKMVTTAGMRLT